MCFGTDVNTEQICNTIRHFWDSLQCLSKRSHFQSNSILRNCDHYFGIINFLFYIGEYPELVAPCILRNCVQYFAIKNCLNFFFLCTGEYPELVAPCGLHQGHRCVERSVRLLRIQRSPRVCPRQLRIQVSAKENPLQISQKIRKKFRTKSATCVPKNIRVSEVHAAVVSPTIKRIYNILKNIKKNCKYWKNLKSKIL